MFAFEYYSISRYMPFLLMKSTPSAGMIRRDELVNKLLMVLNVLAPVANGASVLIYNLCDIKFESPNQQTDKYCRFWSIFQFVALYLVGLLQLISGVYLGYAIHKIKQHLVLNGGRQMINVVMLVVHLATFGLYMLSIIVYYVFYTFHYLDYSNERVTDLFYYSGIFCACSNFLAQACLCVIFWQFAGGQSGTK